MQGPVHFPRLRKRFQVLPERVRIRSAFHDFKDDPHEEDRTVPVIELLRLGDVGVQFRQPATDCRHDTRAVRAGKRQDEGGLRN